MSFPRKPTGLRAIAGLMICCASFAAPAEDLGAPEQKPQPALTAPKAAENRLLDIAVAGSRLVAVGQHGVILISDDGRTWKQVPSPVGVMLTRLRFTDAQNGWALGYDASILQTVDGGQSWALRHHDPKARALFDVLFLDAQRGLAIGAYGQVLETSDAGQTWTRRESDLSALGMHLNVLLRLGDGSLFIAGERGLMAHSVDAGANWQVLDSPYAGSLFGAMTQNEKGVLVYGMRGNLFLAADVTACTVMDVAQWDPYARETAIDPAKIAALGWRKADSASVESLFGALSLDEQAALFVGVNGTTMKLDAAGVALSPVKTPATETLVKVVAFKNRLIAVGRRGVQDLGDVP